MLPKAAEMQSDYCAAQPRTNIVAKREARATSIRLKTGQTPPYSAGINRTPHPLA
jgi:hypothetical protein